jgi:hypothetical protein
MRQIIIICCIFFTFELHVKLSAQIIREENFNIPGKGFWANADGILQSDTTGIDWYLNVSNCIFVNEGDYAKTVTTNGGRFEVVDSDGDAIWSSAELDISKYSTISISIKTSETGSNTSGTKKIIKASYLLDGILHPFSPDSIASGNWGDKILKVEGLHGNRLQLVVSLNSSYSGDKVILDDVIVEGVDSTLFEPQRVVFTLLPSYAFIGEETVISASVFNKNGEAITDKKFDLKFQSDQLSVTNSSYVNGLYSWKVISQSAGKGYFFIHFENHSVESVDSFIQFYNRDNLIFTEDFEKDILTDWQDIEDWMISSDLPISGDSSLKHKIQTEDGVSIISNNNIDWSLGNGNYQFSFKLKNGNWDPSSTNSFYFSLCDFNTTDSTLNGYAIGVNAIGTSDLASIWTIKNGIPDEVIAETAFNWNENTLAQFDINRDALGNWSLSVIDLQTGITKSATGSNNEFELINQIGLHFKYSVSRSGQLWFDDLLIFRKNTPPKIRWVKTLHDGKIRVCFSEEVKIDQLSNENFTLEGESGNVYPIESFEATANDMITLQVSTINETDLLLTVAGAEDLEGAVADSIRFNFEYQLPVFLHDVVITEIMADPAPVIGLPEHEYLEIYNRSNKVINLNDWSLTLKDNTSTLPVGKINPGDYFIVCDQEDSLLFSEFGNVLAINYFPSLLNTGASITLSSPENIVVDSVIYTDDWYHNTEKKNGGWSLEKIDPGRSCGDEGNWSASVDVSGGTPGRINSVDAPNIDNSPPEIVKVDLVNSSSIMILLSEKVNSSDAQNLENYKTDSGIKIDSVIYNEYENWVTIFFGSEVEGNKLLHLTISELSDECGNVSNNLSASFSRQVIGFNDLVINEVLFNPFTDGADFVELYNQSGIDIDISKLSLATRNDTFALKSVYPLSKVELEITDQSYMAFTRDSENITSNYWVPNPERIVQMDNFPSYNDDEGHVVLLNDSLEIIDEFAYSQTMHSKLLSDLNGVSLERLSFSGETNNPANWHSASSLAGFATPGYENSQQETENPDGVSVLIGPDAISPNGDGFNDEMEIKFQLDKPGYLANVFVFDINGRRICRLLNNDMVGNSDKIFFLGVDEAGGRLPMGFYILYTELVHPDGGCKKFKLSFLVTDKR